MKSTKIWIIIAGISGFSAVAFGAFGAHGLKDILSPERMEIYKTGVLYHLIHSAVLLAIALTGNRRFFNSALFFLLGIILFSFSLYLYAITGLTFYAFITPVGGVCFLIAWVMVIIAGVRGISKEDKASA